MYENLKRAFICFAAAAVLGSGFVAVSTTTAQATTTQTTGQSTCDKVDKSNGTGNCSEIVPSASQSEAHASTELTDVSVNGVDINKTTVVARVQAKGATKAQKKGEHLRLKKSKTLWTSYINTSSQEVWHRKFYKKNYLFIKGVDGYFHDPHCWNKVAVKGKKPGVKITGKVKIVKRFKFQVSATATVSDHVTARAVAWANATGCHAEASAKAEASFNASASASVKGRVLIQVKAQAKATSEGDLSVKLGAKSLVDIHSDVAAQATGKATADAVAKAKCEATPPPPPVTPAPLFIETSKVNDVLVNNTRTISVTGTVAPGHMATLIASAKNGGTVTVGKTQSVQGNFTVSVTYLAPSEVPGATGSIPASHDRVDFTLVQDDGQKAEAQTDPFLIKMPIPDLP